MPSIPWGMPSPAGLLCAAVSLPYPRAHALEAFMSAMAAAKIDPVVARLRQVLGDRVSTGQAVREQHGRDESYHAAHSPDVVVFPESTEEVQAVVRICAETATPLIPFGTGTSLE